MNDNFYEQVGGSFTGRVLIQASGKVGGHRAVFVPLKGGAANELVYPPIGINVLNPFKGVAKAYASDLVEFKIDGTGYILKTFEVAKVVGSSDTEILLVRDGYHHIPFVGDVIMKGQKDFATKAAAYTITKVEETVDESKDVWKVTINTTLGALKKGDVLVEGAEEGASVLPLVTNPNMILPCDYDFKFAPASGSSDYNGARYFLTPCFSKIAFVSRMSPIPPAVKALNKSHVDGWFQI